MDREDIKKANRLVVKIGTSTLMNEDEEIDDDFIRHLAYQTNELILQGKEIIIVSSGAVGAGSKHLQKKFGQAASKIRKKQDIQPRAYRSAAAALGQTLIMAHFRDAFEEYGRFAPLILLTRPDVLARSRSNHFYYIDDFLRAGLVPIVNENDAVTNGAAFGGNDNLAVIVAGRTASNLVILLSDVGGFYKSDPKRDPFAELIPQVDENIPMHMYRSAKSSLHDSGSGGTAVGGMRAKIRAAEISLDFGIPLIIAEGKRENALLDIMNGHPIGTLVAPLPNKKMRTGWRAHLFAAKGSITVDTGAQQAVESKGHSLLAFGIERVEGEFEEGDCVALKSESSGVFARGLVKYSSKAIIQGLQSPSGPTPKVVMHRDELVFTKFY